MILAILLAIPLLGAVAVAMLPKEEESELRQLGFVFSLVTFLVSLALPYLFDAQSGAMQMQVLLPWVPSLGINFHLGIDGISLWLVMLTTTLTPVVLLGAQNSIKTRVKEFVCAMLILELGMLGAFLSLDLFLFYVFWEVMLLPMYLIIGIWGHSERIYAAIKFVLYTMVGSLLMLVALIYMYISHGEATGNYTFNYLVLMQSVWSQDAQLWLFLAFALAFVIKVPLFPFHSWLPDAHTQAPTAGSVILAGVLLKLGTYGLLRFAIPLFPHAAEMCAPYIVVLSVVGIVYGALVAFAQKDAKRLIAYSSVSHMGFIMLGVFSMNVTGVEGSLYQMLGHGIATGGLFYGIGVLYDRRHTHELSEFGGIWKTMPRFAAIYLIVLLASAGLPGLNGFIGEFLILVGSFTHAAEASKLGLPSFLLAYPGGDPVLHARFITAIAATGVVLGAVYLLHLFQKLMFGPITKQENLKLPDLTRKEFATFLPLLVLIFAMGVFPTPFLKRMEPAVKSMLQTVKSRHDASQSHVSGPPMKLAEIGAIQSGTAVAESRSATRGQR